MRTTKATLEALCGYINQSLGRPATPYINVDGKPVAQIGNYHMSGAYGGVCVHEMCNESGGVTTPIWQGHIPKAQAEQQMRAYLRGIEAAQKKA